MDPWTSAGSYNLPIFNNSNLSFNKRVYNPGNTMGDYNTGGFWEGGNVSLLDPSMYGGMLDNLNSDNNWSTSWDENDPNKFYLQMKSGNTVGDRYTYTRNGDQWAPDLSSLIQQKMVTNNDWTGPLAVALAAIGGGLAAGSGAGGAAAGLDAMGNLSWAPAAGGAATTAGELTMLPAWGDIPISPPMAGAPTDMLASSFPGFSLEGLWGSPGVMAGMEPGFAGLGGTLGTGADWAGIGGGLGALGGAPNLLDILKNGGSSLLKSLTGGGGSGGGSNMATNLLGGLYSANRNRDYATQLMQLFQDQRNKQLPFYNQLLQSYQDPNAWLGGPEYQALARVRGNQVNRGDSSTFTNSMDREKQMQDFAMASLDKYRSGLVDSLRANDPVRYADAYAKGAFADSYSNMPIFAGAGYSGFGSNTDWGGIGQNIWDTGSDLLDWFKNNIG